MTLVVTGATGFIGRALLPALAARGYRVRACRRRQSHGSEAPSGVEWRECDLLRPETLPGALEGARGAYFLVHSMGDGGGDFRALERRSASNFAEAAARSGLERIVYLGGVAPRASASPHLASRLEVGELLRGGAVPALELRASMVIGNGSASWQIVRDLALRLPVMVLPAWLRSRTRPVALEDVIVALVAAAELPLPRSAWFDLPGPEVLSGQQILQRISALRGRRPPALEVPLLTPRLSALWLKLVTRTDFALARELVVGLTEDLLPEDERFWELCGHTQLVPFDEAASRALSTEPPPSGLVERIGRLEEALVGLLGSRPNRPASAPRRGRPRS